MQITIDKIFQELGRLHVENMRLNEEIASLQAQLAAVSKPADKSAEPSPTPA